MKYLIQNFKNLKDNITILWYVTLCYLVGTNASHELHLSGSTARIAEGSGQ
jgi:hypothetical protein